MFADAVPPPPSRSMPKACPYDTAQHNGSASAANPVPPPMGDDPFRGQRQTFSTTIGTTSSTNVVVNHTNYETAPLPPQPPPGWPGFQAASPPH
eukprot:4811398-Amphidinium_carterae.1